jgi:rod shape-determining protein MreD
VIRLLVKDIFLFVFLVLIQALILNNIQFSGLINPYPYILFILILPFETPRWLLLSLAFLIGISIDAFSYTLGMHTVAIVFIAYLRPAVLKLIAPRDGYEANTNPLPHFYGLAWFLKYTITLTLIHHFVLFYLEMCRFSDFFLTFFRVLISAFFSVCLIIIFQYLFYRR